MRYQCPQCQSTELTLVVELFADVVTSDDEQVVVVDPEDAPDWGPSSLMWCQVCEYEAEAAVFEAAAREGASRG